MEDRFTESNILIQSLKDNGKNKNTQQSVNNWINVWTNEILAPISRDTDGNTAMYNCLWTNKRS